MNNIRIETDRLVLRRFEENDLKDNNYSIGYVQAENNYSYDFGYALCKEYWHQGIVSETGNAVIELLKGEGIPYITATHDRNNPRSGAVMNESV